MISWLRSKLVFHLEQNDLLRGAASVMVMRLLGMAAGYLSIVYIANTFGATDYGVLVLCMTIVSVFSLVPKYGMETVMVRVLGELHKDGRFYEIRRIVKSIFLFTSVLAVLFGAFLYFSSSIVMDAFFQKQHLAGYLKIMAATVISSVIIAISSAYYHGVRKIGMFVFVQILLQQFLFLLVLLVNGILGFTENLVGLYVFASILAALLSLLFVQSNMKTWRDRAGLNTEAVTYDLNKVVRMATPVLFAGSFSMLMVWTDILMIGMYMTESDVGMYTAAQRVAVLSSLALVSVNAVAAPKYVQFYTSNDIEGLKRNARQASRLVFYVSLPVLAVCVLMPGYVMSLFGEEFMAAMWVLVLLSAGQFVNAVSGSVGLLVQMTDNQHVFRNVIVIAAAMNITLNFVLIPVMGMEGAAIASLASMAFWNLSLVLFIRKKLGFWTICFVRC